MFIDTHCHLDASEFDGEHAMLVHDAAVVGVTRIVIPSVSRHNFDEVRLLCKQYPNCFPAYGIHPIYTKDAQASDLAVLRDYLQRYQPVAVGEIGLDFFIAEYEPAQQEFFFIEQLKLAREFDLPVLLHIRRAADTILKHLRQHKVRGGVAHAFNGSRQQADEFMKLGFKLGFGGAMTYPRATKLRALAATLPLENIVLETDAPDIPPNFLPHGTSNQPQYLPRIAQTLAELRGISVEEIADVTTENARQILPRLQNHTRPSRHNQRC